MTANKMRIVRIAAAVTALLGWTYPADAGFETRTFTNDSGGPANDFHIDWNGTSYNVRGYDSLLG